MQNLARVSITKIGFDGRHGVSEAERRGLRRFEVDVDILADLSAAERSDDLEDTIDYAKVAELVVKIGTGSEHHLIESLARRMLDALAERFPGTRIDLILRKMAPPDCVGHPESATVSLTHFP